MRPRSGNGAARCLSKPHDLVLHGIAAEFAGVASQAIKQAAARAALDAGYTRMEAYTPFAVDDLSTDALHQKDWPVNCVVYASGRACSGALTGFGMCWYAFVVYFPINIGGRPHNSWPAWIPITFEMTSSFCINRGGYQHVGGQWPAEAASSDI